MHINTLKEANVTGYGHAFFSGLESSDFAENATACFDNWVYFYYTELTDLQIKYHYGSMDDNIFNTTKLISNISQHFQVCTSFVDGMYDFYASQASDYSSITNYFISFFQNLLANVLNINTIY